MAILNDNLDSVLLARDNIKTAIINKGQTVGNDLRTYAEAVSKIQTGIDTSDATATIDDLADDRSAYVNGEKIYGMVEHVNDNGYYVSYANNVINNPYPGSWGADGLYSTIPAKSLIVRGDAIQYVVTDNEYIVNFINLTPNKLVNGYNIFGINGNYEGSGSANLGNLDITPSISAQSFVPISPIDGYNIVNIGAVTSSIDSNISAENIKKDVNILGIIGTLEAGSSGDVNWNEYYKNITYNVCYLNQLSQYIRKIPDNVTTNTQYIYASNDLDGIIVNAPNVHSLVNFIPYNNAFSFNGDVANWNLGYINNLCNAFRNFSGYYTCPNVISNFDKFDYSNVNNMYYAFYGSAINNCDIFKNSVPLDTQTSINMVSAFERSSIRTLDGLENILINKVIDTQYGLTNTFSAAENLSNIDALQYLSFNTPNLYLTDTFNYCGYRSGCNFYAIHNWQVNNIYYIGTFRSTGVQNLEFLPAVNSYFYGNGAFARSGLRSLNGISNLPFINTYSCDGLFSGCRSLVDISDLDNVVNLSGGSGSYISLGNWFYGCNNLQDFSPLGNMINRLGLRPSNFIGAFAYCSNISNFAFLNNIIYNGGYFDSTFYGCNAIYNLDVFPNFGNITSAKSMFAWCRELTNISNFKYNSLKNTHNMFYSCYSLQGQIGLANINFADMSYMFYNCNNVSRVDISNEYAPYIANMSSAFQNCTNLTYMSITSGDVMGQPINIIGTSMFENCVNLRKAVIGINNNLASLPTASMFYNCSTLTNYGNLRLGVPDINYITHWNTQTYPGTYDGPSYANMFYNCSNLVNINAQVLFKTSLFSSNTWLNKKAQFYKPVRVYGDDRGMGYGSDYVGPFTGMFYGCTNLSNASLNSIAALLSNIQVLPSASESSEPKDLPCTLGTISVIHRVTQWREDWETGEYREEIYDTPIVNYGLGLTSNQINYIVNNSGYWSQLQNKGWSNDINSVIFESSGW